MQVTSSILHNSDIDCKSDSWREGVAFLRCLNSLSNHSEHWISSRLWSHGDRHTWMTIIPYKVSFSQSLPAQINIHHNTSDRQCNLTGCIHDSNTCKVHVHAQVLTRSVHIEVEPAVYYAFKTFDGMLSSVSERDICCVCIWQTRKTAWRVKALQPNLWLPQSATHTPLAVHVGEGLWQNLLQSMLGASQEDLFWGGAQQGCERSGDV